MNERGDFYPRFVVRGTQPHIITPRSANALKFFWISKGVPFSGQIVNHPGTAPNDFLMEAVRTAFRSL